MTRIAFLIQAHDNPQQVARLAKCLLSAGHNDKVYIHVDAKVSQDLFRSVCISRDVYMDKSPIRVNHSGFTQVKATLQLINMAVSDGGFTHYMLLSGQCFPTKPMQILHKILGAESLDYINYYPMPNLAKAKGMDRLEDYHFENWPLSLLNGPVKLLPKRNFIRGLSTWPYAGSNWWTLRHGTILQILSFVYNKPSYKKYMKTVVQCDEVFFQTIISMLGQSNEIKPALFWTKFDKFTNKPFIWTLKDLPYIIENSPFIVRKVNQNIDSSIVDALEKIVLG